MTSVGIQSAPVTGIQSASAPGEGNPVQEFVDSGSSGERTILAADTIGWNYAAADWKANLYAVDSGFCIITTYPDDRIRSITSWGAADTLISDPVKQVLLGSYLEGVKTSNRAYLAIVREGEATGNPVAWGETAANGGLLPDDIRQKLRDPIIDARAVTNMPAISATTNTSGFVVWTARGDIAMWGGSSGNVYVVGS
jgi:hypothetical protein